MQKIILKHTTGIEIDTRDASHDFLAELTEHRALGKGWGFVNRETVDRPAFGMDAPEADRGVTEIPPAKKERKPRAPKPDTDKKPRASSDPGLGAAILSALATAGDKGLSMGELVAHLGANASEGQIRRAIKGLDGVTTTGNKRSTRYYAAAVQS